jgi:riboflavin synthase
MFTGIIETLGLVKEVIPNGSNLSFWISSPLWAELKVDQSLSHNGVCLTVEAIREGQHKVTAIEETLRKTNLGEWSDGSFVNLERCLKPGDRLDGHLVQGHVDCKAICKKYQTRDGSWEYEFLFPKKFAQLVIEKGSIAVNGISLTCFDVKKKSFRVAIIPYTFEHTNISEVHKGDTVNIEFDMAGKYILRKLMLTK